MLEVEILDARRFSITDARAIAELLSSIWPNPNKPVEYRQQRLLETGRDYHGPEQQAPRSFVIREAGQVIAHAALIPRTIQMPTGETTIAGLSAVCSDKHYRGAGLGELVVRKAFELIDDEIFPFTLFQTNSKVQAFYEKLGAVIVDNHIINSLGNDPQANPFWDEVIMRYPATTPWPEGTIDLLGPGY